MQKQVTRKEIDAKYKWRLEDIYESNELWEQDFEKLKSLIPTLGQYKDTLTQSADTLAKALQAVDEASYIGEKLFVYARMRKDEDNADPKTQAMASRAQSINIDLSSAVSYIAPTLTKADSSVLLSYIDQNKALAENYDFMLRDFIRIKPYVLSEKEEKLLSMSADFASGPRDIFTMLNNADMTFGSIQDESGKMVELTHGRYQVLLQSKNREVRRKAFRKFYSAYRHLINTIASSYAASVKKDVFYAKVRGYESALKKELFSDNVPVELYDNLIKVMHENLKIMYEYIELRKKILNISDIKMFDVFAPLADTKPKKYTYEESVTINLEALQPLGADYITVLKQAFESGWVDVHETKGKTSGAYSWGVYGTHPYVLLNHRDDLDSVFTIAHEMGHAMHSYYSNKHQKYAKSGYTIFVAEVASTVNEILLTKHLLKTEKDAQIRKYILNHYLDQFRTTVFRQTMFAEYEKITHDMAEQGIPLTAESLSKAYEDLNALYYGEKMGRDRDIALEWSRIPHFYNAFYVYKYATGFSCAVAIVQMLLNEGERAVARYLEFLKSGGSDHPLELLKKAGVDLASGEPVRVCMHAFAEALADFAKM
jgi:oligoendopeptidase F